MCRHCHKPIKPGTSTNYTHEEGGWFCTGDNGAALTTVAQPLLDPPSANRPGALF